MKKLAALLIALTLLISSVVTPASAAFSDVSDSELAGKLELLSALGIIDGYSDGTYRPARSLTRAEFTKLVVCVLDPDEKSLSYADYTYFPDVRSVHWAARYVNYAARALGLVKGDGSGKFNPDNPISYREAVTIIMRALGYTDEMVGGRWPDGYFTKAAALGLTDGISLGEKQPVDRRAGAELFYNALYTEMAEGGALIDSLAGEMREGVLILSVNVSASDGTHNAILASDGTVFRTRSAFSDELVGHRGTLILDTKGYAVGFVPDEQTVMTLIISRTDSASLTAASGEYLRVDANAPVYTDGADAASTWENSWFNLGAGTTVRVTVGADGRVEYVTASTAASLSGTVVLETVPSRSALCNMLGAPATARIVKNGAEVDVSALHVYDVASYSEAAGVITVSDFRLQAVYEGASPSVYTPDTITAFGGNSFRTLESAASSLRSFNIGNSMVLLFTSDGQVAGAISPTTVAPSTQVGYYDGSSVLFPSGISVQASFDIDAGQLVRVSQAASGKLGANAVSLNLNTNSAWDISAMTFGSARVLPGALIYERLGTMGALRRVQPSEINLASVPGEKILYAGYDTSGNVNILVLDDVTGNGYVYGRLTSSTKTESLSSSMGTTLIEREYITVVNSTGSKEYQSLPHTDFRNEWGAVAISADGRVQYAKPLVSYTGIELGDFGGTNTVRAAGMNVGIAEEVQVYVESLGSFLDASAYSSAAEMIGVAKNMGTRFTVLLDAAPSEGGLVRIIVVR